MARSKRLAMVGALLALALLYMLMSGKLSSMAASAELEGDALLLITSTAGAYRAPTPTPLPREVEPTVTTDVAEASPGPTQKPPVPVIAYFTCDPCMVEPGGASTLSWALSGATQAYLDGQGITAPGSTVVYPDQTTTYRLVAVNEGGQSEKTVAVQVRGLPTIHYFTCLPCEIAKGERATLSWDLSGATAAYLDGRGVTAPGDTVIVPTQTTTYRLVAVSERGSVERLVTVTVKEGGDPDMVRETLSRPGYDVRWAGYLPLAGGAETISVVMTAVDGGLGSQVIAEQYFAGFEALYDNYPGQILTVGLYDGVRYMFFVTVKSADFEAFLRGEMAGSDFWGKATWNVWDDWTGRWLAFEAWDFSQKDFVSKNFGF